MKKNSPADEEQLLHYIDGTLSAPERQALEILLTHDAALKARLEELQAADAWLHNIPLENPSRNFTQQVLSKLDQYPASRQTSFTSWKGIFLLAGMLVAIGITSVLVSAGVFDGVHTSINLNQELPEKFVQRSLPTVDFSGKTMINVIIALNLVLAWLVLDKAVLKPLFQRRMANLH
ncbi:anti-sigma factor family protein [Chryseolinea lacunae]|uniref:Zinc-finger domain-containing protein n=1 Tax=Chryseolinea lacunae TaxID=2801331 RepID=A0ABS1KPM7_9BACT|nr:hypothetical protein [Chryseolinea lacunae]MBL0741304.1 hypothetical protein [Chryseolinea lacunae]